MNASDDPRLLLDEAPLSRAQIVAIGLTTALSALDGFDILSVTFAAADIAREFAVDKAALGLVLSSGLDRSAFPPDIPVGTVTEVDAAPDQLSLVLTVEPLADLGDLAYVRVLLWEPAS